MTLNLKSLSRQSVGAASAEGNSGHSSVFMYRTADTIATVLGTGYFNNARNYLKKGDVIDVVASVSGTPTLTRLIATSVPSSGDVVVVQAAGAGVGGLQVARGQHTTVDEDDTVVTGLNTVVAVVAQLDDDPVDGAMHVTATIGDQAGAPAAGSINIKTWKSTDGDATLIAATTFGKKVNWIAFGT